MTKMIDKIAQRRSVMKRLNPVDMVNRNVGKLNKTYREQYKTLQKADDSIRKYKSEGQSLKELIKELKRNNKNFNWIAVLDRAARINKLISKIVRDPDVVRLQEGRQENFKEFYFHDRDSKGRPVSMDNINSLVNASAEEKALVRQALFGDWSRQIADRFMSTFKYDKREAELRRAMNDIVSRSENLVQRTLDAYKGLDTARNKGNIGDYINIISDLRKEQGNFESAFKNTYTAVKDFLPQESVEESSSEVSRPAESSEKGSEVSSPEEKPAQKPEVKFTPETKLGPGGLLGEQGEKGEQGEVVESVSEQVPVIDLPRPLPTPPSGPSSPPTGSVQSDVYTSAPESDRIDMEALLQQDGGVHLPPAIPLDAPIPQSPLTTASVLPEKIKKAMANGNRGVAVALLSKYSQELEDAGHINESAKILVIAQEIFNGK